MNCSEKRGLTLKGVIGLIAILAILVSAVAPRVFESIQESKIASIDTFVNKLEIAISKYAKDMESHMPLIDVTDTRAVIDGDGAYISAGGDIHNALETALKHRKSGNQSSGKWRNFKGPYLDRFERDNPPIGTFMTLYTNKASNSVNTVSAATPDNFDLNSDGINDIANGTEIVVLRIEEVSEKQWNKIDNMLDTKSPNLTTDQRKARGKVKLDGDELLIFLCD